MNVMLASPHGGVDEHVGQQSTGVNSESMDKVGVDNFQELGSVGFYGIVNNSEIMISIIILTNGSDINEATSDKPKCGSFNNIQQYLVPDIQLNMLKKSLKKIVQNLVKGLDISQRKEKTDQENEILKTHLL